MLAFARRLRAGAPASATVFAGMTGERRYDPCKSKKRSIWPSLDRDEDEMKVTRRRSAPVEVTCRACRGDVSLGFLECHAWGMEWIIMMTCIHLHRRMVVPDHTSGRRIGRGEGGADQKRCLFVYSYSHVHPHPLIDSGQLFRLDFTLTTTPLWYPPFALRSTATNSTITSHHDGTYRNVQQPIPIR